MSNGVKFSNNWGTVSNRSLTLGKYSLLLLNFKIY